MPQSKEQHAQWMAKRRAATRPVSEDTPLPPLDSEPPEWDQLIRAMPQDLIDALLEGMGSRTSGQPGTPSPQPLRDWQARHGLA